LCGAFVQYKQQDMPPMPPRPQDEVQALLDKPASDRAVLGRVSRRVAVVSFRNGQLGGAEGDFTGAAHLEWACRRKPRPSAAPPAAHR
jgi:hypothetical protein